MTIWEDIPSQILFSMILVFASFVIAMLKIVFVLNVPGAALMAILHAL
ncbi:MAG: hypothetical protein A4E48_00236 [Methanosaeta sp. PtaU1.Bin060]|nr:MAG: hypothetical protein A4E48_00236 [Methanosaeta sp. PtaU1.Bin060]